MAKKFKFRLETILKLRTEKVEESKASLNIAVQHRNAKETEIETLRQHKTAQINSPQTTAKAADMQVLRDYINALDNDIVKKEKEKTKLVEIENARRDRLNEAMQQEKVVLKLKEKKLNEYNLQVQREENNFMDEIATEQYIRKLDNN
jgi:flagellar FliJ protein